MFPKIIAALLAAFAAIAFAAVDANKATQSELDAIKGIGPGIATKILDERKKGPFKDWQDMVDRVKGVGPANAAKFSAEGLTVNGVAFAGAPAKAAAPASRNDEKRPRKSEAADPVAAGASGSAKGDAATAMSADDKRAAKKKERPSGKQPRRPPPKRRRLSPTRRPPRRLLNKQPRPPEHRPALQRRSRHRRGRAEETEMKSHPRSGYGSRRGSRITSGFS